MDFDTTALRLNDPLAQVQTQSVAASVPSGGVELNKRFKYVCEPICRYSAAIVVDNDHNVLDRLLKTQRNWSTIR